MALIVGGPRSDSLLASDPVENNVFGDPYTGGTSSPFAGVPLTGGRGGEDKIRGGNQSAASNLLVGDAWEIAGHGRGGSDVIWAGEGSFRQLAGDSIFMSGHGRGANDVLIGSDEPGYIDIVGDAHDIMSGHSRGGNDIIRGGNSVNAGLFGDSLSVFDNVRCGHDVIYGGKNSFSDLYGDAGALEDNSLGGNDLLVAGNGGESRLFGDADGMTNNSHGGNDVLVGANGNDRMYGEAKFTTQLDGDILHAGNDVLVGNRGNDDLWGDFSVEFNPLQGPVAFGRDLFVFGRGSGLDTIHDFQHGKDLIDVRRYDITDFGELTVTGHVVAFDGIVNGTGHELTVLALGDLPITLVESDFLFA